MTKERKLVEQERGIAFLYPELDTPLYHQTLEKQEKGVPLPKDSPLSQFLRRHAPIVPLAPMGLLLSACGAGQAREVVVSPSLPPEATSTPTLIIPQETETPVFPTPTAETKKTPSPEAIVFPQTEVTSEFVKQGFYGVGGEEIVDLGKMGTPEAERKTPASWQTIEGYTSLAWDEKIELEELAQNELKATKALVSLGSQAGVEGFYQPGEILPQFKDLTLLRLTINRLPNNQDFYDAKLNSSPQNLIIRKGTHLTVLGLWADESGRWATVAIDEGFDREKKGIQPRDVPRHCLAVIPQDLPEEVEGLSLSRLLNANDYLYHQGVVEHLGDNGKLYHQELNIIEPTLAKKLEREAGALFMDQKEDGSWFENPVVSYPPQEQKSLHQVKSGETLSKIAQAYGLTVEELLALNPQIKDPSKISVGQEINILIPGFTDYYGPIETADHRVVILSPDQTQEIGQAPYHKETKEWVWERIVVVEPILTPTPMKEATVEPTKEPTKEPTPTKEPEPTPEITTPMSFEVNFDPEVSAEISERVVLTEAGEEQLKKAIFYALSGPFFEGRYGRTPEEVAAFLEKNNFIIKDFRYPKNTGKGAWGQTTVSEPEELDLRKEIILNFVAHAPEHRTGIGLYQSFGFEIGLTDEERLIITTYNPRLTDEGLSKIAEHYDDPVGHEINRMESTIWAALNILANHDENSLEASIPDEYLGAGDLFRVIVNTYRATKGWGPAFIGKEYEEAIEKTRRILNERRGGLVLIPSSFDADFFSI